MSFRKALAGAVTAIAAVVLVSSVQAAPPGDAHERQASVAVIGDAHERSLAPAIVPTAIATDAHDRGTPTQFPTVVASGGFDWGDATIGVVGGMGLALLLGGVAFLVASQRTRARAALR